MMVRQTGTVVMFDARGGYGFLKPDTPGVPDVFVHVNQTLGPLDTLFVGSRVSFTVGRTPRGVRAENVVIIG